MGWGSHKKHKCPGANIDTMADTRKPASHMGRLRSTALSARGAVALLGLIWTYSLSASPQPAVASDTPLPFAQELASGINARASGQVELSIRQLEAAARSATDDAGRLQALT